MSEEMTVYRAGQVDAQAEIITADLFNDFIKWIDRGEKTAQTYIKNFRPFLRWMQETGISSPTRQDIISYRDYLINKDLRPNTVACYLRSVKQFFGWTDANRIYPNVAANVHAPKVDRGHKRDCLTAAQVLTIEKSIANHAEAKTAAAAEASKDASGRAQRSIEQGARLHAMYLLAVNAGLRTVEINRLNVGDFEVRDGQGQLYIWGKGHTAADTRIAISPEVAAAIADYLKIRTDSPTSTSPLFVSTGNRSKGQRIATTTISTMLKSAMQQAGFDSSRLTAHSLRHTAATACLEVTGDIYKTQKYMRHANPATTEIYIHDTEKAQREATQTAQRLYDYFHGQSKPATLESSIKRLTPEQIEQLTRIVNEMAD